MGSPGYEEKQKLFEREGQLVIHYLGGLVSWFYTILTHFLGLRV